MRFLTHALAVAAAVFLGSCRGDDARADFTASPVMLDPAAADLRRVGELEYMGGLRLAGGGVGGLSGMLLDGADMTALSDDAHWFRLRLRHDSDGRLVGAALVADGRLRDDRGRAIGSKRAGDSESMARWQDGIAVSFEQDHRLWLYAPDLTARPRALDIPAGVRGLPSNGGVEALAELPDQRLLLLSEDGGDARFVSGWVGRPGDWREFRYRRTGEFKPTGAALLPSGRVVVVERRFSLIGGLAARVVIIDPGDAAAGGVVEPHELARLEPPLSIDNFEAIAAARGPDGRTILYLLSDDNFSPLQSTLLLAFAIP